MSDFYKITNDFSNCSLHSQNSPQLLKICVSPWRNGRNISLTRKHRENHLKSNNHKVSEELKTLPDIVWHACNTFQVFKSIAMIIVFFDISVVLIWFILNSSYFPLPQLFCQNLLKHSIKKMIFLISQYKRAEIYKK